MRTWKYCPVCGGELSVSGDLNLYGSCDKCNSTWFKNSIPTTSAVLYDRDDPWRVLLVVRGIDPGMGKLNLIGGFLDFGEVPEDAIAREVEEESGLRLSGFEFIGHFWGDDYVYQGRVLYCLDSCFSVGVDSGVEFDASDDVDRLVWVDLRDGVPELAFKDNMDGLMEYVSRLEG